MKSPREKYLQAVKDLAAKPRDPKQWARDILADPNYNNEFGLAAAKKALDPNNLREIKDES